MNFWDKIAGVYDIAEAFNGKVYNKLTHAVAKLTPEGSRVLDCAAGTGNLSLASKFTHTTIFLVISIV